MLASSIIQTIRIKKKLYILIWLTLIVAKQRYTQYHYVIEWGDRNPICLRTDFKDTIGQSFHGRLHKHITRSWRWKMVGIRLAKTAPRSWSTKSPRRELLWRFWSKWIETSSRRYCSRRQIRGIYRWTSSMKGIHQHSTTSPKRIEISATDIRKISTIRRKPI